MNWVSRSYPWKWEMLVWPGMAQVPRSHHWQYWHLSWSRQRGSHFADEGASKCLKIALLHDDDELLHRDGKQNGQILPSFGQVHTTPMGATKQGAFLNLGPNARGCLFCCEPGTSEANSIGQSTQRFPQMLPHTDLEHASSSEQWQLETHMHLPQEP